MSGVSEIDKTINLLAFLLKADENYSGPHRTYPQENVFET